MTTAHDVLDLSPVVPVVALNDPDNAPALGQALLRGGIRTIEVTLRTPAALTAIERLATEVADIVIGAGTIIDADQAKRAAQAGAQYLVTPGSTEQLLDAVSVTGLPCLPGVSTVSEAMRMRERGHTALKFFPAQPCGSVEFLKAIAGPLPDLRFCPTGGISPSTMRDYLALPNVGCVGGSWITPANVLAAGDWARVEELARDCIAASAASPE